MANRKHGKTELEALRAKRHAEREAHTDYQNDNQVLTFRQWCALNNFSGTTAKRILSSGTGPRIVRLSARRYGITVAENRKWQQHRTQKVG